MKLLGVTTALVLLAICSSFAILRSDRTHNALKVAGNSLSSTQVRILAEGGKLVTRDDGVRQVVRPLDDLANPYRYSEWDHWLFENLGNGPSQIRLPENPSVEEMKRFLWVQQANPVTYTPQSFGLRTQVDENGYLVPVLNGIAQWVEAKRTADSSDPTKS